MEQSTSHPGITATETTTGQSVDYAYQGYQILHWAFVAAPLLAGLDKFFHLLTEWTMYLAPPIKNLVGSAGLGPHTFMEIVGAIEIVAAGLVALRPRIGAYVVAAWLAGIIVDLLLIPGYYDIALRDFGLCLAALALGRLSHRFDR